MEIESLVSQYIGNRIVVAALDIQSKCGQKNSQLLLIDYFILTLLLHLSHQFVHLCKQFFISATSTEIQLQITARRLSPSCVGRCGEIERQILRAISLLGSAQSQVVDQCLQTMCLLDVGCDIHMSAHRRDEGLFHESHGVEVSPTEVGCKCGKHTFC